MPPHPHSTPLTRSPSPAHLPHSDTPSPSASRAPLASTYAASALSDSTQPGLSAPPAPQLSAIASPSLSQRQRGHGDAGGRGEAMATSSSPAPGDAAGQAREQGKRPKEPQTEMGKADQVVQHFYFKTLAVIAQARLTHPPDSSSSSGGDSATIPGSTSSVSTAGGAGGGAEGRRGAGTPALGEKEREKGKGRGKTNKWFNLELPDPPSHFRDPLRTWRNVSTLLSSAPSGASTSVSPSPSTSSAFAPIPSPAPYDPLPHSPPPPPPRAAQDNVPLLVLETVLDVSDLTPNQVLVLDPSPSSSAPGKRIRVDPALAKRPETSTAAAHPPPPPPPPGGYRTSPIQRAPSRGAGRAPGSPGGAGGGNGGAAAPSVVLERWELRLLSPSPPAPSSSTSPSSSAAPTPPDLSTVYKHSILHFRSLYTLVRALPAYGLYRKLARRRAGVGGAGAKVTVRLSVGGGGEGREGEVGVEVPIEEFDGGEEEGEEGEEGEGEGRKGGQQKTVERVVFPGVVTPLGTLSLTLLYRLSASFSIDEIETLLSSRFIDEDFFRPTVAARRYSSSATGGGAGGAEQRPGSLPISSRVLAGGAGGAGRSPAHASPPAGAFPPPGAPGMTGLAPLPSYGSLSSRHQYAPSAHSTHYHPHPPSPLSTSPALVAPVPLPPPSAPPSASPVPAATPAPSSATTPAPGSLPAAGAAGPSSVSSSSRFSAYAPPGTSLGAAVEPAFISLSRARGSSFAHSNPAGAGGGSAIQRASPAPAPGPAPSPSSPAIGPGSIRRTSLTGSSASGSPIFRPGSYISSSSAAAAGAGTGAGSGLSSSPSFSGYYGPITRQQPLPIASYSSPSQRPGPSEAGGGGGGGLVFGSRSPLAPAVPYAGPSMLGATAPSSFSPSSGGGTSGAGVSVGVGIAIGGGASASSGYQGGHGYGASAGAGGTPSSSSLGRGGAGPFGSAGGGGGAGSYVSRSYGRGSASASSGEVGPGWGAAASGGAGEGAPGLVRRASSRLSFAAGSPSSLGRSSSSRLAQIAAAHRAASSAAAASDDAASGEGAKRFANQAPGEAPEDADDINAFLGMLESRPDLKGGFGGSFVGGGASSDAGRSVLMSKRDVDEQMRQLRSSFLGGVGGGGESPSPPSFGLAGSAPRSVVGPSGLSGISSLRKQTSRLSIEEDAAGEAEAEAAKARAAARERERTRSPSGGGGGGGEQRPLSAHSHSAQGQGQEGPTMTTPRGTFRALSGAAAAATRRGEVVSPSLSATSSSTVLPPLPPLSLGGDPASSHSPLSHAHNRLVEPRFLPLPTSSTTSPLASPGISRERDRDVLAAFALTPAGAQPYPPLPYPPTVTTTTSTSTHHPITFAPYLSSRSRSSSTAAPAAAAPVVAPTRAHAIRQPLAAESSSGFATPARPASNVAGSVSSFASSALADDVETDVEAAMSSYRADDGEVEAVGRLELDDSPSTEEVRGRRWPGVGVGVGVATSEGQAGEAALASAAAAAQAQASRDSTPAARGATGYFGAPACPPMLAFAGSRSRGGSRAASGERRRESPPDISWMG